MGFEKIGAERNRKDLQQEPKKSNSNFDRCVSFFWQQKREKLKEKKKEKRIMRSYGEKHRAHSYWRKKKHSSKLIKPRIAHTSRIQSNYCNR